MDEDDIKKLIEDIELAIEYLREQSIRHEDDRAFDLSVMLETQVEFLYTII